MLTCNLLKRKPRALRKHGGAGGRDLARGKAVSNFHRLDAPLGCEAAYLGPHLSTGPLPALFYFSLSSRDSLCNDPYNQPALYLSSLPLRIFSLSLPGHEENMPPTQALYFWAQEIGAGRNLIEACVQNVQAFVEELKGQGAL